MAKIAVVAAAVASLAAADQLEVRSLTLQGVTAFDEDRLADDLQTKPSSWLPWRAPRHFDAETLDEDLERIAAFYRDHGYPDARVTHDLDVDEAENAVDITIRIEKGAPLRVKAIAFSGFDALPPAAIDRLRDRIPLDIGRPIVRDEVIATGELAVRALQDQGYPYAEVGLFEAPAESGWVRVGYRAEPGNVAFFGPIDIVGNVSVEDEVIRRELRYHPGELFRRSRIEESQRRISALNLFQSVNIETVKPRPPAEDVRTRVTVKEGKIQRTIYSVGYGTEEQAAGELGWEHLNFLGDARSLSLRGRWSSLDRGGQADFAQPYFFHPRLTLSLDGHYWDTDEPVFDFRSGGGRAALITEISQHASVAASFAAEHQRSQIAEAALDDPAMRDQLIAFGLDPTSGEQAGLLSTVGIEARRATTTNRLNPRDGTMLSLRLEQAGDWLPGDFHFIDLVGEGRVYRALGDRVVAAGRLRIGAIDPSGPSSDIPFHRRYFLGGATSLRGWGRFEVSPLSESGLPIGGQSLLEMSAELRFPAIFDVSGVVFADGGQVWEQTWTYPLNDLLWDVGAGMRYNSPFGLLRLDVGYQLTPTNDLLVDGEPQSRRWRVHFGIGQAF